jgi:hypothetical protein
MRKYWATRSTMRGLAALGLLSGLAACQGLKEQLGLNKQPPDEFTIVTKAPLVMPPDYTLRPPRPGAEPTQETAPRQLARDALLGNRSSVLSDAKLQSLGETSLLAKAGASNVDPSIRDQINRETSQLVDKDKSFADALIFWRKPAAPGTVIDAEKESQRLRENSAVGLPPTEGDSPIIKKKKKAIFEGIF